MKKRWLGLLAGLVLLVVSSAWAAGPKPLFTTADFNGWYVIDNVTGNNGCGTFSYNGIVGLDGAGHIINKAPPDSSYIVNQFAPFAPYPATCPAASNVASKCSYNIMTPSTGKLYTVSADSSIVLPMEYLTFKNQPPACNADHTTSTLSGLVISPSEAAVATVGGTAQASGKLVKQYR